MKMMKVILSGKVFTKLDGEPIMETDEKCPMCKQAKGDGTPISIGEYAGNTIVNSESKGNDRKLYPIGIKMYACQDDLYTADEIKTAKKFFDGVAGVSMLIVEQINACFDEALEVEVSEKEEVAPEDE